MVSKSEIVDYLDRFLDIATYKDSSANGLQVDGKHQIRKVGFAVDACLDTIRRAAHLKCDMLVVHHGLFWDRIGPIVGRSYHRFKALMDMGISLYGVHAPLDIHRTVGNNAQLLKLFQAKPEKPFGYHNEIYWGYMAKLPKPLSLKQVKSIVDMLNPGSLLLDFGKKNVSTIGVVSGGSAFAIAEGVKEGLDLVLIGEMKHELYHTAKEGNINVLAAGHYATESLGIKALQGCIERKFKIHTDFIDWPTGL